MRNYTRVVKILAGITLSILLSYSIGASISAAEIDADTIAALLKTTNAAVSITRVETNEIIASQNEESARPIASLTKLMTALVVVESNTTFDTKLTVLRKDVIRASTTYLRIGDQVTIDTLLRLMLVGSDNVAARVLSRAIGITSVEFVRRMNARADELGMRRTRYVEPSGLSSENHSTLADINTLMMYLVDTNCIDEFTTSLYQTKIGRRTVVISNTNRLFREHVNIQTSKTGYTGAAKYCLTMTVEISSDEHYIITILGAPTSQARWVLAASLHQALARVDDSIPIVQNEDCGMRPETISEQGKAFIRQHEDLRRTPYYDVIGYAVGYGMHTWRGRPVTRRYPSSVTESEVEDEFDIQLNLFAAIVHDTVCVPLTPPMFDALVSVAWNLGRVNTSIVHKVDSLRPVVASDFLTTAKSRNRQNPVLVQRRLKEYLMFTGNYEQALNNLNSSIQLKHYAAGTSVLVAPFR